jgi:hypothetical protein
MRLFLKLPKMINILKYTGPKIIIPIQYHYGQYFIELLILTGSMPRKPDHQTTIMPVVSWPPGFGVFKHSAKVLLHLGQIDRREVLQVLLSVH